MPHQVTGKDFLKSKRIAYLGDVMGIGKTAQAIVAAKELIQEKDARNKVLIVYPAHLELNWMNELEFWQCNFDVTLCSYSSLHKIKDNKYDIIIADEAHYVKNHSAKRTKLFYQLATKTKYVWLLSGTPITRCTVDLYPFLKFAGVFPGSYYQFADRYAETKIERIRGRLIKKYFGGKNLKELKELFTPLMLRRFNNEVKLPDKVHNEVVLAKEFTSKYEPYMESVSEIISNRSAGNFAGIERVAISTLRRELGVSKVESGLAFITGITRETSEQVILFAYHRDVIKLLGEGIDKSGGTFSAILGGQTVKERSKILKDWKTGKIQYLIISIEAASTGLNLTEASKAFFIELPWNPDTLEQAIGRIHRIGQKEVTNIFFLLKSNSFDYAVKRIILDKRKVINYVTD